jgi:hypothetical protein
MGSYPKIASMVGQQRVNLGTLETGSIPLIERDKSRSVKAR